jgi:protoporphyrinogen oxidase
MDLTLNLLWRNPMPHVVIIGAGPSGLAAAYALTEAGYPVTVLERDAIVGGLARTLEWNGYRFDIGPHRFFTKSPEVNRLWQEALGPDLLSVDRTTRILYQSHFFDYPLAAGSTLKNVGVGQAASMLASYAASQMSNRLQPRAPASFEDWVVQRFGRRLYDAFFKTYTEKVWGIPCATISADWAGQRIKGLTLAEAIKEALRSGLSKDADGAPKTLIQQFLYPREGAGMLYQRMARTIEEGGGTILCNRTVRQVRLEHGRVVSVQACGPDGQMDEIACDSCLSSTPLTSLVECLAPEAPEPIRDAAAGLRYRDHLSVNLIVEGNLFPDQWIYVHSREVRMARIANYRNFSACMSPRQDRAPITVEYFSFAGDDLGSRSDEDLLKLARQELHTAGICEPDRMQDGFVVRSKQAYPVAELGSKDRVAHIREYLQPIRNLWPIGRCGMFKYNNQDHAIMTGLLAARAIQGEPYDPWNVNIDAEYHENGAANTPDGAGAAARE